MLVLRSQWQRHESLSCQTKHPMGVMVLKTTTLLCGCVWWGRPLSQPLSSHPPATGSIARAHLRRWASSVPRPAIPHIWKTCSTGRQTGERVTHCLVLKGVRLPAGVSCEGGSDERQRWTGAWVSAAKLHCNSSPGQAAGAAPLMQSGSRSLSCRTRKISFEE